jgi:hypothetical protein
MTRLYQGQVSDSWFRAEGLGWYVTFGEARSVDGEPMVQLNHGIFPADGWYADKADAVRAAADRIEELGFRLVRQAAQVRAEAESEVPHA